MTLESQFQDCLKTGFVMVVPFILVCGALATALWRYSIERSYQNNGMRGFMVLVVLQLLPLAILKVKTWLSPDRVSLVPLALVKTLMMHVALQVMRLLSVFVAVRTMNIQAMEQFLNFVVLIVVLYLLHTEFNVKVGSADQLKATMNQILADHKDMISLVIGSLVAGVATEIISPSFIASHKLSNITITSANFMEILTFVPAVQMVCLEIGVEHYTPGRLQDADKRKIKIFMAFIIMFYLWEDVLFTILEGEDSIICCAKCAHFLMLLDFAGFFILKIGVGPKFVEEIVSGRGEASKGEQMGLFKAPSAQEDIPL